MALITHNLDQFIFNLNRSVITEINNSNNLVISAHLQQNVLDSLLKNNYLIFFSYYCDEPVIKTIYYCQGELIQQVTKSYLDYPDLLQIVTQAHYLLINKLIAVTPEKKNKNKYLFLTIVVIMLVILILMLIIIKGDF